jgi:hypothetical protein
MLGGCKIGDLVIVMGPHECAVYRFEAAVRGKSIRLLLVMQRSNLRCSSRFLAGMQIRL